MQEQFVVFYPIFQRVFALLDSNNIQRKGQGVFVLSETLHFLLESIRDDRMKPAAVLLNEFFSRFDPMIPHPRHVHRHFPEINEYIHGLLEQSEISDGSWEKLLDLLETVRYSWQRLGVLADFSRALLLDLPHQSQELHKIFFESTNSELRNMALAAIAINKEPDAFNILAQATQDADTKIRCTAIQGLGRIQDKQALGVMRNSLHDSSQSVQLTTIQTLANMGTPEAFQVLNDILKSGEKRLRIDAAKSLGQTKNDVAARLLIDYACIEADSDVLQSINESIAQTVWYQHVKFDTHPINELRRAIEIQGMCNKKNCVDAAHLIERCIIHLKSQVKQEVFNEAWESITTQPQPEFLMSAEEYSYRGAKYFDSQQYEEALTEYDKAIKLGSNNAIIYRKRGDVYLKLNKLDLSLADYNKSLTLDNKDYLTYLNCGFAHYTLKHYNQALEAYGMAVTLKSGQTNAYYNMGCIYSLKNNIDFAIRY